MPQSSQSNQHSAASSIGIGVLSGCSDSGEALDLGPAGLMLLDFFVEFNTLSIAGGRN